MTVDNDWSNIKSIHSDLKVAKEIIYDRLGFICTLPKAELESADYAACDFKLNNLSVKYRAAKITPTKIGQFVTLWKRNKNGPIEPLEITDDVDLVVISVRYDNYFGQFVFPKSVLVAKGIVSANGKEGKRAFRVYPSWDIPTNKQAEKTQLWQLSYFLEFTSDDSKNIRVAQKLYINKFNIQIKKSLSLQTISILPQINGKRNFDY